MFKLAIALLLMRLGIPSSDKENAKGIQIELTKKPSFSPASFSSSSSDSSSCSSVSVRVAIDRPTDRPTCQTRPVSVRCLVKGPSDRRTKELTTLNILGFLTMGRTSEQGIQLTAQPIFSFIGQRNCLLENLNILV